MRDKNRGDPIGTSHCNNCKENTEREYFGFVPHHMMDIGPIFSWFEVQICTQCGSLTPLNIIEDDVERIEEDYVYFLVEKDIIDESEAEDWLEKNKKENT